MFSPCFQICTEQALAHRHHQKSADDSRKLRAGRRRVIADTADRRDQFLTRLHYATALQSPGGMYSYTTHYTTQQLCKALVVRILTPHITPRNSFTKPWWYVFLQHTLHHATALQSPGGMYSYTTHYTTQQLCKALVICILTVYGCNMPNQELCLGFMLWTVELELRASANMDEALQSCVKKKK